MTLNGWLAFLYLGCIWMIDNGVCDHTFKVSCVWLRTEKGRILLLDLSWIFMSVDLIFDVSEHCARLCELWILSQLDNRCYKSVKSVLVLDQTNLKMSTGSTSCPSVFLLKGETDDIYFWTFRLKCRGCFDWSEWKMRNERVIQPVNLLP